MIEPNEPDGLRTLRSMAALCGRSVYERVDNWHVRAAFIGPPFNGTVWCYCEKAMPFSDRVGLIELSMPSDFSLWESFYRRYGGFTIESQRAKWVSPEGGYTHPPRGHTFGSLPLPVGPNPLSILQAGLARR